MTSSSVRVNVPGRRYTGPDQARLDNKPSAKGSGAWEPKDSESYIQIEFDRVYDLKNIRTQGSTNGRKFVTRFFLFYTVNGKKWIPAFGVSSLRFILLFRDLTCISC